MKDRSKLVKKPIVDKTGKKTFVWVKADQSIPDKKKPSQEDVIVAKIKTEEKSVPNKKLVIKQQGKVTESESFKKWFGKSKVVDDNGDPLVVYHGTTHNFEQFDSDKIGNVENALGIGHYFTTSSDDAGTNYAGNNKDGVGPDLKSRIEQESGRIESDIEYSEPSEISSEYEISEQHARTLMDDSVLREEFANIVATKKFKGDSEGSLMAVYLKSENPFDLTGDDEMYIEWDEKYYKEMAEDEVDKNDYKDDKEGYEDALNDKALEIYQDDYFPSEDGEGVAVMEAFDEVIKNYEEHDDFDSSELRMELNDGMKKQAFVDYLKKRMPYISDLDGNMAVGQFISDVVKKAGYDGLVQDANLEFGYARKDGKPMDGINQGDKHYIMFDSTQIKSATGNSGEFDPKENDITKSDNEVKLILK